MFRMEIEYKDEILFVKLKGILNRKQSFKINNYLNPVIKKHNIKYLIYNFEELEGVDNAGMDALTNSKCFIKSNKGKIRVYGVNDNLKNIFKNLKIPRISKNSLFKLTEMV